MKVFALNSRVVVALGVAALLVGSAHADPVAIGFDTSQFWSLEGGVGNFGWQFTPRSEIRITALGLYDNPGIFGGGFPGDGFLQAHAIGIWDVANPSAPLVSAIIPAGTVAPLFDGFRYVRTPPVTLSANGDYVVAALYSGQGQTDQDFFTGGPNNPTFVLTVNPEIAFGGYRYTTVSSALTFPDNYIPGLLYAFGPNFTFSSVPEPSGLTLGVLAAAIIAGGTRMRNWRLPF